MPQIKIQEFQDGPHLIPNIPGHDYMAELSPDASLEEEIDAMVMTIKSMVSTYQPDVIIGTCMSLMGRCTELHIQLVRAENSHPSVKKVRTMQLRPLMEMIDFTYKAASRLVEVSRQEVELSR